MESLWDSGESFLSVKTLSGILIIGYLRLGIAPFHCLFLPGRGQEKDSILLYDGKWMRPRGATPTSHIFKLPLGFIGGGQIDLRSSVENEWLWLKLLSDFDIEVPEAKILTLVRQPELLRG